MGRERKDDGGCRCEAGRDGSDPVGKRGVLFVGEGTWRTIVSMEAYAVLLEVFLQMQMR